MKIPEKSITADEARRISEIHKDDKYITWYCTADEAIRRASLEGAKSATLDGQLLPDQIIKDLRARGFEVETYESFGEYQTVIRW